MKEPIEYKDKDGTVRWKLPNGQLHNDHGPAIIRPNGYKAWFQNNLLHRDIGPALILENGSQRWYQNGFIHRTDGPAIIYADGSIEYYLDGKKFNDPITFLIKRYEQTN